MVKKKSLRVLVTGGLGYIGSHSVVELISSGYDVVILDNLSNSNLDFLDGIEKISGVRPPLVVGDVLNIADLNRVFSEYKIDGVVHFAGLKSVGESIEKPLLYFENNVSGTLNLLKAMEAHGIFNFVFSSSATVYGDKNIVPFKENMELDVTNPYGRSKLFIERILGDLSWDSRWNVVVLRYFNPVGAHPSGLIGEDPHRVPSNLMPYICRVASGRSDILSVFGNSYDTVDGTGVRDFVHVIDLAEAHAGVLNFLFENVVGFEVFNVGTGRGYSVLELLSCFEKTNGVRVPYVVTDRRSGDVGVAFADVSKIGSVVGWFSRLSLEDMCRDAWKWEKSRI